jgi:hypothetical protein
MRRICAIGLIASLFTAFQIAPAAHASGVVLPPPKTPVTITSERAIVSWDGKSETITMLLNVQGASKDMGLIIPTPGPAIVSGGNREEFDILERTIRPQSYTTEDWWGTSIFAETPENHVPTILTPVQLDPIGTTNLIATDKPALDAWLKEHNYTVTPGMTSAFANYASLGWSLTALTISASRPLTGTLDPITLTFPTRRLVYPLTLSSLTLTPLDVRLYAFDSRRDTAVQANRPTLDFDGEVNTVWAGALSNPVFSRYGQYLTVIDLYFSEPNVQVKDDIAVLLSADARPVTPRTQEFRVVSLLGIPVGTLVVAWLFCGLLCLFVYLRLRRRYS